MKKVELLKKAICWYQDNIDSETKIENKIARGMKYEHMFKKLWEKMVADGEPPPQEFIEHYCKCKTVEECWRRFRKELEK